MFMLLAQEVLFQEVIFPELGVKHCTLLVIASGLDPIQHDLFVFLNCHGSIICFRK
jgi:hypothetical protein